MTEIKLDYTGERLVTEIENEDTIYHLHRYAATFPYIKDKVIVDIASGEGYGSNLMAKTAAKVIGIDIDKKAVDFASSKYKNTKNLRFIIGAVEKIPIADRYADIVVSFETLEHTINHEEMLKEIKRILKPNGILIISSPDKANYSDRFNRINEFHIKELYMHEFKTLLKKYFNNCHFYYQTFLTGSYIIKENFTSTEVTTFEGNYDKIESTKNLKFPIFNLAISSDSQFIEQQASYFEGGDVMRNMYFKRVMGFTPYRLGNLILKPLRFLFKKK